MIVTNLVGRRVRCEIKQVPNRLDEIVEGEVLLVQETAELSQMAVLVADAAGVLHEVRMRHIRLLPIDGLSNGH